jgi:hypothetical protein
MIPTTQEKVGVQLDISIADTVKIQWEIKYCIDLIFDLFSSFNSSVLLDLIISLHLIVNMFQVIVWYMCGF